MSLKSLFHVLEKPASPAALEALQATCGNLPASYLAFLAESNGAEWCVHDQGGDCLSLWPSHEVPKLNEDYEIARWVPSLIAVGSDGGGDAIGFDRLVSGDPELWPVVRIGFGNLGREDFVHLARGFGEWQAQEFRLQNHHAS
jgi:hypothetical protein